MGDISLGYRNPGNANGRPAAHPAAKEQRHFPGLWAAKRGIAEVHVGPFIPASTALGVGLFASYIFRCPSLTFSAIPPPWPQPIPTRCWIGLRQKSQKRPKQQAITLPPDPRRNPGPRKPSLTWDPSPLDPEHLLKPEKLRFAYILLETLLSHDCLLLSANIPAIAKMGFPFLTSCTVSPFQRTQKGVHQVQKIEGSLPILQTSRNLA
jgi:hypothetical protein